MREHEAQVAEGVASARGPGIPSARRRSVRPSRVGPVIVMLGLVVFVVGCFLPFSAITLDSADGGTASLFRLLVVDRTTLLGNVGGALYLFGGAIVVGVPTFAGIKCGCGWTRPGLFAAVGAWAATWVGSFMNGGIPGGRVAGFWVMILGVALALAGTLKVWADGRTATPARASRDAA